MEKVSVITVVYNDVTHIRATLESFFSQTWQEKEYIVIDGGSTDGTADIVREYSDRLAFWCSEPDGGIYEAMNKGIAHCQGDWINVLNSGDVYVSPKSLEEILSAPRENDVCVLYGHSYEMNGANLRRIDAQDPNGLEFGPTFRHGSALVRTSVQKYNLFDLSKKKALGYALDWQMLYTLYKQGHTFQKVDALVEAYRMDGVSNRPYLNLWYNYKITSQGNFSLKKFCFFVKLVLRTCRKRSIMNLYMVAFIRDYMVNSVLPHLPFWCLRRTYLRMVGLKIGKDSFVHRHNSLIQPHHLHIGVGSHINQECIVDARGGIKIGDGVCISHRVNLMTGSHDVQSLQFMGVFKPITIGNHTFLGVGCTVLQGVEIGEGAVVAAGAVVTHDVEPYTIVSGIPAKEIGKRNKNLEYMCNGWLPLN